VFGVLRETPPDGRREIQLTDAADAGQDEPGRGRRGARRAVPRASLRPGNKLTTCARWSSSPASAWPRDRPRLRKVPGQPPERGG
jgi:hypothetical protein